MNRVRFFMATMGLVCLVALLPLYAQATVINVPGDYATIQAAIGAAGVGDTVLVGPGTYNEAINFLGKAIVVKSSDGPLQTVITAGSGTNLVTFATNETADSKLEGFWLQEGWMAIRCANAGPTIQGNILSGQNITNWGAISLGGTSYATTGPCPAVIINNTIVGCANGGISTYSTVAPTIKNNIIAQNAHYGIHRHGQDGSTVAQPILSYNDVWGNPVAYQEIADPGVGTIASNPLFGVAYTLTSGSPCIDAGDPNPVYNDPDGTRNDMGAVPYDTAGPGVGGNVLRVPSEYPAIQLALNAAVPGDTVLVAPGVYKEYLTIFNNGVVLISEGGAGVTAIEPASMTKRATARPPVMDSVSARRSYEELAAAPGYVEGVVCFSAGVGPLTELVGFTIRGEWNDRGVYGANCSPTVRACVIEQCAGPYDGGGIFFQYGAPVIRDNLIRQNTTPVSGGGIFIRLGYGHEKAQIRDNVITGNMSGNGPAISLIEGAGAVVTGNFAYNNTATDGSQRRGAVYFHADSIEVVNNTIDNNSFGLTILSVVSADVRNNLITNNTDGGMEWLEEVGATIDVVYDYNDVWNNGANDYLYMAAAPNDLSVDPQYEPTLTGAYYLLAASPAIDAGDPDPSHNDPDGSRNDLGARPYTADYTPHVARTIVVPSEYPTIQEAIEAAYNNDTVLVLPGAYGGGINFLGKLIRVVSSEGPTVTTITGSPEENLVTFRARETAESVLEGFRLEGGWIGVLVLNAGPTIKHNLLIGQQVINWGAISLGSDGATPLGHCPAQIINTTILGCENGGISTFSLDAPTIMNTIIAFNMHYGIHREGWLPGVAQPNLAYNDVYGNPIAYQEIADPGVGTLAVDPLFAADYSLAVGSPCIDAGNPGASYNDPDGSRNDMGAIPSGGLPVANNRLRFESVTYPACESDTLLQPVVLDLEEAILGAMIPFKVPEGATYCGFTTAGLITETWEVLEWMPTEGATSGAIGFYSLASDSIPAGQNAVVNLLFTTSPQCEDSRYLRWDTAFSSDPQHRLTLANMASMNLSAQFDQGMDSTEILGYMPGDVNGDETVNLADLTCLVNMLFKHGTCMCSAGAADMNASGNWDIGDLTYLVSALFRGGAAPLCGAGPMGQSVVENGPVTISAVYADGQTVISLSSAIDLLGLHIGLSDMGRVNVADQVSGQIELIAGTDAIGLVDLEGATVLPAGSYEILRLEGQHRVTEATASTIAHEAVLASIASDGGLPASFELKQNYPNPFNPSTEIEFTVPAAAEARLTVLNVLGQTIAVLVDGRVEAGTHTATWDGLDDQGRPVSSGIYFYRLASGSFQLSRKMLLVK